jgi:hypothetical protein
VLATPSLSLWLWISLTHHLSLIVVNAERAAYEAPSFAPKIQRTRATVWLVVNVGVSACAHHVDECAATGWYRHNILGQEEELWPVGARSQMSSGSECNRLRGVFVRLWQQCKGPREAIDDTANQQAMKWNAFNNM